MSSWIKAFWLTVTVFAVGAAIYLGFEALKAAVGDEAAFALVLAFISCVMWVRAVLRFIEKVKA
jgi:hypothetical protein